MKEKLKWCWQFTKREMVFVAISLFLSFLISYFNSLEPLYTGSLVNMLSQGEYSVFVRTILYLFLIQAIGLVLTIFSGRLSFYVNKKTTLYGQEFFISKVIKRDNYGYLKGREAEVQNVLQSDISVVLSVWTSLIPNIIASTFNIVLVSFRLFSINAVAFFLTVFLSLIPFIVYKNAGKKEKDLNKEAKKCGDNYICTIKELISISYDAEGKSSSFLKSLFMEKLFKNYSVSCKKLNLTQGVKIILFLINVITISIIYAFLGFGIYKGKSSVGDFMAAVLFSQQLRSLINSYGGTYKNLIAQSVSIDRVRSIIERKNSQYVKFDLSLPLSINIENITFKYPSKTVFSNYSLFIGSPGLYVIKGINGKGKTTLLYLIANLLDASYVKNGEVIIGNCLPPDILVLPSFPCLVSASIRDNLLLGDKKSDEDVLTVIKNVGLKSWLESQQKGLETICDLKQMGLSKGQLMRFSLASVLLRERKIYLIDEIEDGIDFESRREIVSIIKNLSTSKIVMIISHSDIFDSTANEIIKI